MNISTTTLKSIQPPKHSRKHFRGTPDPFLAEGARTSLLRDHGHGMGCEYDGWLAGEGSDSMTTPFTSMFMLMSLLLLSNVLLALSVL